MSEKPAVARRVALGVLLSALKDRGMREEELSLTSKDHRAVVMPFWLPLKANIGWMVYCPGCQSDLSDTFMSEPAALRLAASHRIEYGLRVAGMLARQIEAEYGLWEKS
jgi:hypothetical protein